MVSSKEKSEEELVSIEKQMKETSADLANI